MDVSAFSALLTVHFGAKECSPGPRSRRLSACADNVEFMHRMAVTSSACLDRALAVLLTALPVARTGRSLFWWRRAAYRLRLLMRLQAAFRRHLLRRDRHVWRMVILWTKAEHAYRRCSRIGSHCRVGDAPESTPPPPARHQLAPCGPLTPRNQVTPRRPLSSRAPHPNAEWEDHLEEFTDDEEISSGERSRTACTPDVMRFGVRDLRRHLQALRPGGGGSTHASPCGGVKSPVGSPPSDLLSPASSDEEAEEGAPRPTAWVTPALRAVRSPCRRGSVPNIVCDALTSTGSLLAPLPTANGRRRSWTNITEKGDAISALMPVPSPHCGRDALAHEDGPLGRQPSSSPGLGLGPLPVRRPSLTVFARRGSKTGDTVLLWELFRGRTVPDRMKWMALQSLYAMRRREMRDHAMQTLKSMPFGERSRAHPVADFLLADHFCRVPLSSKPHWLEVVDTELSPADASLLERQISRTAAFLAGPAGHHGKRRPSLSHLDLGTLARGSSMLDGAPLIQREPPASTLQASSEPKFGHKPALKHAEPRRAKRRGSGARSSPPRRTCSSPPRWPGK